MAEIEAQTSPEAAKATEIAEAEGAAEAEGKKKGKKDKIFALIALPLVAALTFFLMTKFITPRLVPSTKNVSAENSDELEDKKKAEDDDANSVIWVLGTALANPSGSRGKQIMKVGVALELASNKIAEKAALKHARLMDILMMVLSAQTLERSCTLEGKSELKTELKQKFMLGLGVGPEDIRRVYFNEFVVQ